MAARVDRRTVDLSEYPDLVVIYLGMRVRKLAGIKRLFGLGPQIAKAGQAFYPPWAKSRDEHQDRS